MIRSWAFISLYAADLSLQVDGLYGQNFVSDTKQDVLEYFNSLQVNYSIDTTVDGFEYTHFRDGEITVEYYFNDIDVCVSYRMLFPYEVQEEFTDLLDLSFERISESMWKEFDGKQYFIWTLSKVVKGYCITVSTEHSTGTQK